MRVDAKKRTADNKGDPMEIKEPGNGPAATNVTVLKMKVESGLITLTVDATSDEIEATCGPGKDAIDLFVAVPDKWLKKGINIRPNTSVLLDSSDGTGRFIAHTEDSFDASEDGFYNVLWIVLD
jgi:hypothetical protein